MSAGPQDGLPRIGVMLSGTGRTLQNLLAVQDLRQLGGIISLVVASKECRGAEIARDAGIETQIRPGEIAAEELGESLRSRGIELIALCGYLRKVGIPEGFEGRILNIHPALLPDFGGHGMYGHRVHAAVLKAGRAESGCTVHLVDDAYDTGPIVIQKRCRVLDTDTPDSLAARVFEQECIAYPEAIRQTLSTLPAPEWARREPDA